MSLLGLAVMTTLQCLQVTIFLPYAFLPYLSSLHTLDLFFLQR